MEKEQRPAEQQPMEQKPAEQKPMEQQPEERKHRGVATAVLRVIAAAAAVALFCYVAYIAVSRQIINTALQSMEEMANHDERAILSNLHSRWETLSGIGAHIRSREDQTTDELLDDLAACKQFMSCLRLGLMSEDGLLLISNGTSRTDPELLSLARESGGSFIRRATDPAAGGSGAALVAGTAVEPFIVEGQTYFYVMALMDVDALSSDLMIDSYEGRGYSSVIAQDGSYIVNTDSGEAWSMDNFYAMLAAGEFPAEYSLSRVQELIAAQEHFSFEYTRWDGERCVVVFDPMPEIDWFFVTVVPRAVFREQSVSILVLFFALMIVVLAVVLAAVVTTIRRRSRLLAMEQEHRREMADALALAEQASRAKTSFLNNMSHDIRTPMNAIIGFTALAASHLDDRERVRDYLAKIGSASDHLLSLINDILDMSRIESGEVTVEEAPADLAAILRDLRDMILVTAQAKGLTFQFDMSEVADTGVRCDKLRLDQILLNILSNAVKFTPSGGTVSLRVSEKASDRPGSAVYEFRVSDTGIGMSGDFLETIFEPFTREKTATVSGIQGTGLGMAITKQLVDMMGGSIRVLSREGEGSEFAVDLEFQLCELPQEPESPPQETAPADFRGRRLLLAEDNELNREIAVEILTQAGFEVETAENGREAVDAVSRAEPRRYDAVLMDIQMPVMDGYEAARTIRALPDPARARVPIVAMTANAFEEDKRVAQEAGMDGHVGKPIDIPVLMETLRTVLRTGEEG